METNLSDTTRKKIMIAIALGSLLELYDFTIFTYFMSFLMPVFFPHAAKETAFIYMMLIYSANFFIRPLSSFFWGYWGDRKGRIPTLIVSITIMAITTFILGVLPSANTIGIAAPILLVIVRMIQGISFGGEFPGAMCFALEYAPQERRGLYVSWIYAMGTIGLLLGTILLGFLLINYSMEQVQAWGWRIPFILGIILTVVAVYLRKQIPHSLMFLRAKHESKLLRNPVSHALKNNLKQIIHGFFLTCGPAAMIGVDFMYISLFVIKFLHYPIEYSFYLNFFICLLFAVFIPVMGYVSDRMGRKYILWWGLVAQLFLSYPLYHSIEQGHVVYTGIVLFFFGIFGACILGGAGVALAEMFPTNVRYTGVAICFNFAYGIFTGMIPMSTILWTNHFGYLPPLGLYLIICMLISILALWRLKETYQKPLELGSTE